MNDFEMTRYIAKRVPVLARQDAQKWKHAERLRQRFTRDYSFTRIPKLALDEYVIGKGKDNLSFCYRLERELDDLGRILGATADKFGVYYGGRKSDPSRRYRHTTIWGQSTQ